jgi:hypothetical protein
MAHRGPSARQSWMRADTHDGPEHRLHNEAEYINAALTFATQSVSSCDARPDHTSGTKLKMAELPETSGERTLGPVGSITEFDPFQTFAAMAEDQESCLLVANILCSSDRAWHSVPRAFAADEEPHKR